MGKRVGGVRFPVPALVGEGEGCKSLTVLGSVWDERVHMEAEGFTPGNGTRRPCCKRRIGGFWRPCCLGMGPARGFRAAVGEDRGH